MRAAQAGGFGSGVRGGLEPHCQPQGLLIENPQLSGPPLEDRPHASVRQARGIQGRRHSSCPGGAFGEEVGTSQGGPRVGEMPQSCRGWGGLGCGSQVRKSRVKSSCTSYWLCDLRQVISPLCASMSPSVNRNGDIYPSPLLWYLMTTRRSAPIQDSFDRSLTDASHP